MSVDFDYPSICDFFAIAGNCGAEKLDDYEALQSDSERMVIKQVNEPDKEDSPTL